MDKVEIMLTDLVDKISKLAEKHGPDAIQLLLDVTQYNAILNIGVGVLCLGLVLLCYILGWKFYNKAFRYNELREEGKSIISGIFTALFAFGFLVFGGMSLDRLVFTPWNYVSAINPKVGLAHQIIDRVLNPPKPPKDK